MAPASMKFPATLAVMLALASVRALACPALPANSGFDWVYKQGPDFAVCYANEHGSEETAFGIYFGENPSFRATDAMKLGKGRVAGREVTWYKQAPAEGKSPLGRETVIHIDKRYGAVAHVWVRATTETELEQRLSALEQIAFDD